ncbi:hypothetical protein D3C79_375260 [compost metagenome]
MTALNELKRLDSIKNIVLTPEWNSCLTKIRVDSDNDLTGLVEVILNQLRSDETHEAKARALLGCLYLTRRISNICIRLRDDLTANSLELDLSIALALPGEATKILTFNTPESISQPDTTNSKEGILSYLQSIVAHHVLAISNPKDQTLDLPLAWLSKTYTALMTVTHYQPQH